MNRTTGDTDNEWNVFENKKIILQEIEKVTELMRRYLIEKLNENE